MAAKENEKKEDPRTDQVDASKGIFPFGTKHPKDAEVKQAGSLGGGPYEESGRSGLDTTKKG